MPDEEGVSGETRVHAREQEFTLNVKEAGLFTVLSPVGRYTDTLLGVLVQDFLDKPGHLAIDLSRLDAVTLPLVRAVGEYAAGLKPGEGRVVLLRPPDKIRSLVKLVAREGVLPIVLAESDLEGDLDAVEARVAEGQRQQALVRGQLETNPSWQLSDADSRWLCPFCATPRPDIRTIARGSPTASVVDRVQHHLLHECPSYTPGATEGRSRELLERELSRAEADRAQWGADPTQTQLNINLRDLRQKLSKAEEVQKGSEVVAERKRRLLRPVPPSVPHCDMGILYRPGASGGGEFYDFIRLDDRRIAFVVGGVSGHDLEPGILMGMARKALAFRLRQVPDLAAALVHINEDLYEDLDRQSYVAAVVAVVDLEAREMAFARAGQAAPFLVRPGAPATVTRLEAEGNVLGLVQSSVFEQGIAVRKVPLQPRDILLLHSDGLEEVKHVTGKKFGPDRLAAVLRANAHLDAPLIVGAVALEVEHFSMSDRLEGDVTALCVRVL
jgi:serine phosphatase RsbU (regulator of sigma subunit)